MRAINLLPKSEARSGRGFPSPWVLLAALAPVVAVSFVYLGYSMKHSAVVQKRSELQTVRARLAALAPAKTSSASQAQFVTDRVQRESALADALVKRLTWDVTLEDLARVLPGNVWLTSLSGVSPTPADVAAAPVAPATTDGSSGTTTTATTPAPAPTVNPNAFTMGGNAPNHAAVALLLARLSLLPMLSNVTLQSTSTGSSGPATPGTPGVTTKPVLQFEIAAALNPPQAETTS